MTSSTSQAAYRFARILSCRSFPASASMLNPVEKTELHVRGQSRSRFHSPPFASLRNHSALDDILTIALTRRFDAVEPVTVGTTICLFSVASIPNAFDDHTVCHQLSSLLQLPERISRLVSCGIMGNSGPRSQQEGFTQPMELIEIIGYAILSKPKRG